MIFYDVVRLLDDVYKAVFLSFQFLPLVQEVDMEYFGRLFQLDLVVYSAELLLHKVRFSQVSGELETGVWLVARAPFLWSENSVLVIPCFCFAESVTALLPWHLSYIRTSW